MNHDELLAEIDLSISIGYAASGFSEFAAKGTRTEQALRAVVELHKPETVIVDVCLLDGEKYPCSTIQAIEKELK